MELVIMGKKNKKKNIEPEQVVSYRTKEDIFEEHFKYLLYKKRPAETSKDFENLSGYNFLWWGVDRHGYIFNVFNVGSGAIPKVVVNNIDVQNLADFYFNNFLEFSTSENIKVDKSDYFYDDIGESEILLARKGIFSFITNIGSFDPVGRKEFEKYPYWHKKLVAPLVPIKLNYLDDRIQQLMSLFIFDVDVKNNKFIELGYDSKTYKNNLFKRNFPKEWGWRLTIMKSSETILKEHSGI